MLKKRELLLFFKDRLAATLLIALFVGALVLIGMTAFNIRISDVQVPIRYSDYGFTNLYRDKWYALLSFGLFGVILSVTNGFLTIKLYNIRRGLGLALLGISILIMVVGIITAGAVFRLAGFSL